MSTNVPDSGDKDIVDTMIGHLAQPCSTEAGNLRDFYIRESERLLQENRITDDIERERLQSAIRMAKIMRDSGI